jgi:hypothetical protein
MDHADAGTSNRMCEEERIVSESALASTLSKRGKKVTVNSGVHPSDMVVGGECGKWSNLKNKKHCQLEPTDVKLASALPCTRLRYPRRAVCVWWFVDGAQSIC